MLQPLPVTESQLILLGYTGREFSKPTNSLPHFLPEKDKEYQCYLRVVESVDMGTPFYSC